MSQSGYLRVVVYHVWESSARATPRLTTLGKINKARDKQDYGYSSLNLAPELTC